MGFLPACCGAYLIRNLSVCVDIHRTWHTTVFNLVLSTSAADSSVFDIMFHDNSMSRIYGISSEFQKHDLKDEVRYLSVQYCNMAVGKEFYPFSVVVCLV